MSNEHVIPDEVLEIIQAAINRNENWMAYNHSSYFLEKEDLFFFKDQQTAREFASDNISDVDHFNIIKVQSISDVLRQIPYGVLINKKIDNLLTKNLSIMNEQNLSYLKDNIKYQGFGETMHTELENQLQKDAGEFTLGFKSEINKREIEATLYFKRSETSDMYFFNKYDVRTATEKKDELLSQTFYMNKGHGVTLKEAYNLLNGRAIHKELIDKQDQKYQAWIQLDFSAKDKNGNYERKQYHQNYGYDVSEALSYYPIKEVLNQEEKEKLIRSLEKGNVQMVTIAKDDKEMKVFIEANPQYKSLNLYDTKMQRLSQEQRQELMQKPEIKQQNKEVKQELSNEKVSDKKQSKSSGKVPDEKGLIQKKRISDKKGLSI